MDFSGFGVAFFSAAVEVAQRVLQAAPRQAVQAVQVFGVGAGHPGVDPGVQHAAGGDLVYLYDELDVAFVTIMPSFSTM